MSDMNKFAIKYASPDAEHKGCLLTLCFRREHGLPSTDCILTFDTIKEAEAVARVLVWTDEAIGAQVVWTDGQHTAGLARMIGRAVAEGTDSAAGTEEKHD